MVSIKPNIYRVEKIKIQWDQGDAPFMSLVVILAAGSQGPMIKSLIAHNFPVQEAMAWE